MTKDLERIARDVGFVPDKYYTAFEKMTYQNLMDDETIPLYMQFE